MRSDRVTLEVLKNYFISIAEGMGYTLERTAHTTFIKESADFATAIATPEGEFFSYPRNIGVTSFLGLNMRVAIEAVDKYEPGDIVITNDPYSTAGLATHLPDIHLFKPLFHEGRILCFAWCFIHCSDVGGLVAASISPRASEIQQEGFRIPPRKLFRAGKLDDGLLELFLANCRVPDQNWGDLKAMLAALNTAERRMTELVAKFGVAVLRDAMTDILDWTEDRVKQLIRKIPNGQYSFSDYLDDDGDGIPIRLAVTVHVDDQDIELDYSGTDPQVNAAFNLPAFGEQHPFLAQGLINYMLSEDPQMPISGAIMRRFRIHAPKGTVVNPMYPAAVGIRYATVLRLYNVVLGALAQAVPEKVPAAGAGQGCMVVLSVPHLATGERQVTVLQPLMGGGAASRDSDGVEGNDSACGYLKNTPIENIERHIPVLVERYDLVPDSAGVGRHRGGWGTRFDFRVLQPGSIVTARGMERYFFEPWGLAGGRASNRTQAFLNRGKVAEREVGRIDVLQLEPADVVTLLGPGGGGYGDPYRREPEAVLKDVRSGLLGAAAARDEYGVVFDGEKVDEATTAAFRKDRRREPAAGARQIDLGPSRATYEARWTPELSTSLALLLLELPPGLRAFAKRELHRLAETGELGESPSPAALAIAWEGLARKANGLL